MSSTTSYKVRPATLRDAKAIAELQNQSIREVYRSMEGDTQVPFMPVERRQAYWREAIEFAEPQVQVAVDDDKIVGFVGFDRSRDKGTPPTMGEVWALFVAPSHWSRGVGQSLWEAAREGLLEEGCSNVSVWVTSANERAMHFFEANGFVREQETHRTVVVGVAKIEEQRLRRPLN